MKLFHTRFFVLTIIILSLTACGGGGGSDKDPAPAPDDTTTPTTVELSGQFQKGPFIVGTEITIQELNDDLTPTGRSFQTETTSNLGDYLLPISLSSSLVEVSANGYYFNEVTGALSNATLRLSALADTSDNTVININILTHLAKKRIRALVTTGNSFSDAIQQAETEVRSLFSFDDSNTTLLSFNQMDISQTGNSNAFLLLASSILQKAYESSAELSEYIESLSQDLSGNGEVDNNTLTDMINATELIIDLSVVRTNLEEKYNSLGQSVVIPEFESFINRAPIAHIESIQTGQVGSPAALSGTNSVDIDNDNLQFIWILTASPVDSTALITDDNTANPSFIPDKPGSYTFSLTVNDGQLDSLPSTMQFSTLNSRPNLIISGPSKIFIGEQAIFDTKSSSDPDNDTLTFQWSMSKWSYHPLECEGCPPSDFPSYNWYGMSQYEVQEDSAPFVAEIAGYYRIRAIADDGNDGIAQKDFNFTVVTPLSDNGDLTITDTYSGLMWQKEDDGNTYSWWEANGHSDSSLYHNLQELDVCGNLTLAGYSDWRIPTFPELESLVDMSATGITKISSQYFPTTKGATYSTSRFIPNTRHVSVDFATGNAGVFTGGDYVRCVRQ